jgi:hypothetical protein
MDLTRSRSVLCPNSFANSMVSVRQFFLSLGLALALSVSCAYADKEKPSPSPAPKASDKAASNTAAKTDAKTDAKAADNKSDDDADFQVPMPIGVPVKGLRIPQYDENGKQVMLFDAEVARKIDADNMAMENLKIEATSDEDKKFYVELPKSIFNLPTRILTGTDGISIRRDDFQITGDAGEFQTKSRFAKVSGNIKMIIFNTQNLQ